MSAIPTRLENTCEGCGKRYRPHQKTQRFCSRPCKSVGDRKRHYDATALMEAVRGWLTVVDPELTA